MLQVAFLAVGLAVLTFVIAFIFKKHQRVILWIVALLLFIGTSVLLGIGLIRIIDGGIVNHAALLGVTLAYACSGIFVYGAEKTHKAQQKHVDIVVKDVSLPSITETSQAERLSEESAHVVLPEKLDTALARQMFARAIEEGFIEEAGSQYKWKMSKTLLAYMCGRIYCEDAPKYDRVEKKCFWKAGRTEFFPDSDLNTLFGETDLGQSRQNRKGRPVPQGSNKVDKLFE